MVIANRYTAISRDFWKAVPKKQHCPRKCYDKGHQNLNTLSLRKYADNKWKHSRTTTTEGCCKPNSADMQVLWQQFCGNYHNRWEQRTQKEPLQGYRDCASIEIRNQVQDEAKCYLEQDIDLLKGELVV